MKRQRALAGAALWLTLVGTSGTAAQVGPPAGMDRAAAPPADPIRCWSKSGNSAVYLGERFSFTVTCRVVDTDSVRVAVEESGLDPASVRLSPFDVVDGMRYPDLRDEGHRLFQYQYSLRIIADGLFGREVSIPPLDIRYRIQRAARPGPAVEGSELVYRLPALPVRVAALVSSQAVDIRDAPSDTFGGIQAARLRGRIAFTTAALLFSAALGCAVMAAGGVIRRQRVLQSPPKPLPEREVLRHAMRELERVRHGVDRAGWGPDAIGQALASVRLAMAIAIGRPPSQSEIGDEAAGQEGALVVRTGLIRPRRVMMSAAVTAETPAAGAAQRSHTSTAGTASPADPLFDDFRATLRAFTGVRYGRRERVSDADLDRALKDALSLLRRVQARRSWRNRAPAAIARAIARRRPWTR